MSNSFESHAYDTGWYAYRNNVKKESNPYVDGSYLFNEWNAGWDQAKYDSWVPEEA